MLFSLNRKSNLTKGSAGSDGDIGARCIQDTLACLSTMFLGYLFRHCFAIFVPIFWDFLSLFGVWECLSIFFGSCCPYFLEFCVPRFWDCLSLFFVIVWHFFLEFLISAPFFWELVSVFFDFFPLLWELLLLFFWGCCSSLFLKLLSIVFGIF